MVSIGRKNLLQERGRFIIGVGGVASAILLVLLLSGIYLGFTEIAKSYFLNAGGDLWVGSKGSGDIFHSPSILPSTLSKNISSAHGVQEVEGIFFVRSMLNIHGKDAEAAFVGYDPEGRMGGPWQITQGSSKLERGQVIIDLVFASKHSLNVGENLAIRDRSFRIVGVSEGGNVFLFQMLFLHRDDVASLFDLGGTVNYFLVSTRGNVDDVKTSIEAKLPKVTVLRREEFAQKSTDAVMQSFTPILAVIVLIGAGVGTAVIGLMVYTLTIERSREYGVLKAIGASNFQLYKIILQQAFIMALVGFAIGWMGSIGSIELMRLFAPEVTVTINWPILGGSLVLTLLMSLFASVFPAKRIGSVDPLVVFRT